MIDFPKTKQEIFNRVWDHFVTRKSPLSMVAGTCRYRRDMKPDSPVRCAVGIFIPDELYTLEMEECGRIGTVLERLRSLDPALRAFLEENLDFLRKLQRAHDQCHGLDALKGDLEDVALDSGLTVPR